MDGFFNNQGPALSKGTVLNGRYELRSSDVKDNFILYVAEDLKTNISVEIEENYNKYCWRAVGERFLYGITAAQDKLFLSVEPKPLDTFLENGTSYRVYKVPRGGLEGIDLIREDMRCPWCLARVASSGDCPVCGRPVYGGETEDSGDLPVWSVLAGKFLVGKRVASLPGSRLYMGLELPDRTCVTIREYFPAGSRRDADGFTVLFETDPQPGLDRFVEDLRLYGPCGDAGFARLRESFLENGTAYAVTDAMEGMTLARYVERVGVMPTLQALFQLRPLFEAVSRLHAAGFAHTRLTPELIQYDGRRMLPLFSGADPVPAGARPLFLAPETAEGGGGAASDVWSLAAVLVFCLTGKALVEAFPRSGAVLPDPPEGWPSPAYKKALLRALSDAPSDRYGDVRVFYNELLTSFCFSED